MTVAAAGCWGVSDFASKQHRHRRRSACKQTEEEWAYERRIWREAIRDCQPAFLLAHHDPVSTVVSMRCSPLPSLVQQADPTLTEPSPSLTLCASHLSSIIESKCRSTTAPVRGCCSWPPFRQPVTLATRRARLYRRWASCAPPSSAARCSRLPSSAGHCRCSPTGSLFFSRSGCSCFRFSGTEFSNRCLAAASVASPSSAAGLSLSLPTPLPLGNHVPPLHRG